MKGKVEGHFEDLEFSWTFNTVALMTLSIFSDRKNPIVEFLHKTGKTDSLEP